MTARASGPPSVASWVLSLVLPSTVEGRCTLGDLIEEYHRRPRGIARRMWFWLVSAELIARYLPIRLGGLLGGFGRDAVYALRLARKHPGLVTAAVMSLSLAIGVCTAAFTIANSAFLRPNLAADPSLVKIWRRHAGGGASLTWPPTEFAQLRGLAQRVSIEGAVQSTEPVGPAGDANSRETTPIGFVTGGFLTVANAKPYMGRLLDPNDDRRGSEPVVVLDHLYWRRHFGADPRMLGRVVSIRGLDFRIVGVVDRDFIDPVRRRAVMWAALSSLDRLAPPLASTPPPQPFAIGRLHPGATIKDLNDELTSLLSSIALAPRAPRATAFEAYSSINADEIATNHKVLIAVFSSIALVLILASANVSNLQLAGAAVRQQEIAVRLSCGASRRRVLRQVLTESALLSGISCAAGLLVARWLGPLLATGLNLPGVDVDPDPRVYLFVSIASVLTAIGTGLAPAYFSARSDISATLSGAARHQRAQARPGRAKSLFIAVQAAASIVLVSLAALQVRALAGIAWMEPGFDVPRLLAVSAPFPRTDEAEARLKRFWPEAIARVRVMPGVDRASLASYAPLNISLGNWQDMGENATDADYFAVTGMRFIKGRPYSAAEVIAHEKVAVISEGLARRHWKPEEALGSIADRIDSLYNGFHVIGIVADVFVDRVDTRKTPMIYLASSTPDAFSQIVVQTPNPAALADPVRSALHDVAPDVAIITTVIDDVYRRQFERPRRYAALAASVAIFALVLSVVGVLGVSAFSARTRTREIGIRLALGARREDVVRLLVRDGLLSVVIGLAVGVFVALLAGHAIAGPLYGLSERDPLALTAAVTILLLAALTAVLIPTRRAARLDPAEVLRDS